jgi:hypothetical protein
MSQPSSTHTEVRWTATMAAEDYMNGAHESVSSLREHLAALPPGSVDKDALLMVLRVAWDELDGGGEHAMHCGKLDRLEEPRWEPWVLCFDIERHGATALGSTYAEVQTWAVDVQAGTAEVVSISRRKVKKSAPRMNMKAIANEVAELIRAGADDARVKRKADGSVMVLTKEFLPPAAKQTMEGRRRRFYMSLDSELSPEYVRTHSTYRNCED